MEKAGVYYQPSRAPKKDLFTCENFAQTLRFLLLDAFKDTDPHLTQQIKLLHEMVSTVFSPLFPGTEVPGVVRDAADTMAPTSRSSGATTAMDAGSHTKVATVGRLSSGDCRASGLPLKQSVMIDMMRAQLATAYERDYGRGVTLMPTAQRLRWWKKVSFNDASYVFFSTSYNFTNAGSNGRVYTSPKRRIHVYLFKKLRALN